MVTRLTLALVVALMLVTTLTPPATRAAAHAPTASATDPAPGQVSPTAWRFTLNLGVKSTGRIHEAVFGWRASNPPNGHLYAFDLDFDFNGSGIDVAWDMWPEGEASLLITGWDVGKDLRDGVVSGTMYVYAADNDTGENLTGAQLHSVSLRIVADGFTSIQSPPKSNSADYLRQVAELWNYINQIVSATNIICLKFDCGKVSSPARVLDGSLTIGSLVAAVPLSITLGNDLKALNDAVAKYGKDSPEACRAAHTAYASTQALHRTLVSAVFGLEFIFPVPEGGGPSCSYET